MRDPWLWLGLSFLIAGGVYGADLDTHAGDRPARRAALSPALLDQLEEMHNSMADGSPETGSGRKLVDVIIRVQARHARPAAVMTLGSGTDSMSVDARKRQAELDLADLLRSLREPDGVRTNPDEGIHPVGTAMVRPRLDGAPAATVSTLEATDIHPLWLCRSVACRMPPHAVEDVARRTDVEMVFPDRTFDLVAPALTRSMESMPMGMLGDPRAWTEGAAWGVAMVDAPALWARGLTGTNVVVGQIDTGVAMVPLLDGRIAQFADFTGRRKTTQPHDDNGHGTHTAGILCASGGLGVAPGARLVVAKALDRRGSGRLSQLLAAMEWMTHVSPSPRLVSCSWGIPVRAVSDGGELFAEELTTWENAGILGVFASGNEGPGTLDLPGACPQAIAVGALDSARRPADFTSSGTLVWKGQSLRKPEVWAPGVDVTSLWPAAAEGDRVALARASGTSQACPHAAGVLALVLQAHPRATPAQLREALIESAHPVRGASLADHVDAVGSADTLSTGVAAPAGERDPRHQVRWMAVTHRGTEGDGTHRRGTSHGGRSPGVERPARSVRPVVACIDAVVCLDRLGRLVPASDAVAARP